MFECPKGGNIEMNKMVRDYVGRIQRRGKK